MRGTNYIFRPKKTIYSCRIDSAVVSFPAKRLIRILLATVGVIQLWASKANVIFMTLGSNFIPKK